MVLSEKKRLMFSVIIPTYNYAEVLDRSIRSVLNQTGDDFEVLVIDDGSTDHTAQIMTCYKKKFPKKIKYFLQKNKGPAAARNKGAEFSSGEYLFFLDADDEMAPSLLDKLREKISNKPTVDVIFGDHISVDHNGKSTYSATRILPETPKKRFKAYIFKKLNLSHCAKILNRRVFERVSYPAELRISEDIPFMAKILATFECELLSVPMAVVHKHKDSLRHNTAYAKEFGESVADHIFSSKIIPSWALKYEKPFRARRCLSIFRTLYLANQKNESIFFYKRAISLSPVLLFRLSYAKKAIGAWLND
ncbi:MAG: glycosyl transferase [Porticoccus sp.]|jgi:glycosyltransferase involved in cell wall biosynthesis|nr:glycosyl transferase [Porticoccus sp.]|tara:strand:- start:408 stop:1325 length:918 start_codon:yes stop_codon:yes gene_type:complete